jgi:hypothetical protein
MLHLGAFHPSRWFCCSTCLYVASKCFSSIQVVCFMFHPDAFMLFTCPCGGFYVSSIQVVGLTFHPGAFHPSKWWVLRFIHPGGRFNVSSIQVMGSMFHPSRWWVLCFIHPGGGFRVLVFSI